MQLDAEKEEIYREVLSVHTGSRLYAFLAKLLLDLYLDLVGTNKYLSFKEMFDIESATLKDIDAKNYAAARLKAFRRLLSTLNHPLPYRGLNYKFDISIRMNERGVKLLNLLVESFPEAIGEEDYFTYKDTQIPFLRLSPLKKDGYRLGDNIASPWYSEPLRREPKEERTIPVYHPVARKVLLGIFEYSTKKYLEVCCLRNFKILDREISPPELTFFLRKSTYNSTYVTNYSIDERFIFEDDEDDVPKSPREMQLKTKSDYLDFEHSSFGNAVMVNVIVANPDLNICFIAKHSQRHDVDKGYFQLAAEGYVHPELDLDENRHPCIFKAAKRSIQRDMASQETIHLFTEPVFLTFGIDVRYASPHMLFISTTALNLKDIRNLESENRYIFDGGYQALDYSDLRNVDQFLKLPVSPANKVCLILGLRYLRPDLYSPGVSIDVNK